MKKVSVILVSLVCIMLFSIFTYAGEWKQEGANWKYIENGEEVKDQQKRIDGTWYYFGEDGNLLTGYQQIGDKFYAFKEDGSPNTNEINYLGRKFSVNGKGEIKGILEAEFNAYVDSLTNPSVFAAQFDVSNQNTPEKALALSNNYFSALPISRRIIKKILKEKQYDDAAIDFVLKTLNIDWKAQAMKCGKEYFVIAGFDRTSLKKQLELEEFSSVEAAYGTEMTFNDATLVSGIRKTAATTLLNDFYKDMAIKIAVLDGADLETARKKYENPVQNNVAETTANVETKNKIVSSEKLVYQLSIDDDDEESGKKKVKISLKVPTFAGVNEVGLNAAMKNNLQSYMNNVLRNTYYDQVYNYGFTVNNVRIIEQNDQFIRLSFDGNFYVEVKIDLVTYNITAG